MRRKPHLDESAWRAQRRVLFHARQLLEEALVERHNEAFYQTLVKASRSLLLEIGAQPGVLAILFQEALEEVEDVEA